MVFTFPNTFIWIGFDKRSVTKVLEFKRLSPNRNLHQNLYFGAILFQIYSDGADVQFPNCDLLPGTHAMGSKGSLACRAYLDTGTGTSEDVFYLLAMRGPTRGEGKWGIEPGSSDPKSSPLPLRHSGGRNSVSNTKLCALL